jgi:thiosulfate/3-mercaptopyruvate sulfurtransferase
VTAFGPLVTAEWLHAHIGDADVRVIDFRWYLVGRRGAEEYAKGHILGAAFVELDDVTGKGPGRHPLPTLEQFQAAMRTAGVDDASAVVVYDDVGGSVAARLWFLLRWFGHERQAVLDGGLQAWGEPLDTAVPHIPEGSFTARRPDRSRVLDFEQVATHRGVPVIDSRAGERYRGEKEPVDPKAGHIPGARNAPFAGNLQEDGRFKSREELRRRFEEVGVDPEKGAVVYCGSGVNACHNLLAMELAGVKNVRLYEGSWSDWSSRDAPIATGSEPG